MVNQGTAGSGSALGTRRQISAVFMDIVGFGTIANAADPEDLQDWLGAFYAHARRIIEAHDGKITDFLGNGLVAMFGLEHADKDAASKAVKASMALLDEIDAHLEVGISTLLRIGVATGTAAVGPQSGSAARMRATAMVATLAQRVQERAKPGTVMIAENTQALLRGTIPSDPLQGFAETQSRFRPSPGPAPAPRPKQIFVGRSDELSKIAESVDANLLVGPAGIGKSAMVQHLAQQAEASTTIAAESAHLRASYHPFKQWLLRETGSVLPKYEDITTRFSELPEQARQALALVLGLPEGQKLLSERSNVALKTLIDDSVWRAIRATQTTGLLIFEDLQWMDNASFGVLAHILQSNDAEQYQILMTSRNDPKIDAFLGELPVNIILLEPLSDTEAAEMLDSLSQGLTSAVLREKVVSCAGGNPLFIEQIALRDLSASDAQYDVPDTLEELLSQQIDATRHAKPVLQVASVIGRQFDFVTLRAVTAETEPLERHLAQACAQGILRKDGKNIWTFAHTLLQHAAYQSTPWQVRVDLHAKIAAELKQNQADAVARDPSLLTKHLSLSQQHSAAVENHLMVSQLSLSLGAFDDAEAHVVAGLALCDAAPDGADIHAAKIACYAALGAIRMQTQGFTTAPVMEAFDQVVALTKEQSTHLAENGPAFYGIFTHAVIVGDKAAAVQFSDILREVAETDDSEELRLASLNVDTAFHFYAGDFAKASETFETLRDEYNVDRHAGMMNRYGADTYASAQMFDAVARAIRGDAHLVPDLIAETDAHQAELDIPIMQPWALIWGAIPLYYAGKTDTAVARVRRGLKAATKQSSAFWQLAGTAWLNVMDTSETYNEEGLAGFRSIIKRHETIGARSGLPYFRAHYAAALGRHDRLDDAYRFSLQAVRENEASGLHCWYPEVLRLHAHICELRGGTTGAARFRREAAAVASEQNALLWLLRVRRDQLRANEISGAKLRDVLDRLDPAVKSPEVQFAQHMVNAI